MNFIYCDAALPWQIGFQDPASPAREGLVLLHDSVMFYLVVLATLVSWRMVSTISLFNGKAISHKYRNHGTFIEVVWTITPALILIAIAFPSFRLLYVMDKFCPFRN
jgi:cytochrome c oxidase subunit 2